MDTALCNPQKVATLLLGGSQSSEYRTSLAFTPQFPCGVEYGGDPLTYTPLRPIQVYNGCVGEPSVPGAMVLVAGRVQSALTANPAGVMAPRAMQDCEPGVQRTQPRVKLRVTHCNRATSLIIDSNSQVVVPAGNVRIEALVPGPSASDATLVNFGEWREYGRIEMDGEEPGWWDTRLEVMACPVACCSCGTLTERIALAEGSPVLSRVFVTPHGSRRLYVSLDVAGAPTDVDVTYAQDFDLNLGAFGADTFAANNRRPQELFGDPPAIILEDITGTALCTWEICGP